MAYISINYDEGNTKDLKYESVEIHYEKNKKKFFNTGNFVKDWFDMRKFMILDIDNEAYFVCSSSVNHFIMDGGPYDSAFQHIVNEKPVLKYIDYSDDNHIFTQQEVYEGIEFFVTKGTQPTWDELKEICK